MRVVSRGKIMFDEEWRDVLGAEGHYKVSSYGRVRSVSRIIPNGPGWTSLRPGKILKQNPDRCRYMVVNICISANQSKRTVHSLVLDAYMGPTGSSLEACHNNGDPADNSVWNLRWDTHRSNISDRGKHGRDPIGSKNGRAVLTESDVIKIRDKIVDPNRPSLRVIADEFRVKPCVVHDISSGRNWSWLTGLGQDA